MERDCFASAWTTEPRMCAQCGSHLYQDVTARPGTHIWTKTTKQRTTRGRWRSNGIRTYCRRASFWAKAARLWVSSRRRCRPVARNQRR